jgi:hypothetical protein
MLRRHTPLVLAVAAALALAAPAARADCGGVQTARPTKRLGDFRAPLAIGDSVLLGAIPEVARQGFEINTHGCRQWPEGQAVVRARERAGTLPHEVVMFLGADWTVSSAQIRSTLRLIGPSRVLVLVTPRELGGGGSSDAEHMREAGRRHPTRVLVLDWVRYTRGRPGWFAPDGIHLGPGGARGLARFLRRAVPYATPGAFPGPVKQLGFAPDPPPPSPPVPA